MFTMHYTQLHAVTFPLSKEHYQIKLLLILLACTSHDCIHIYTVDKVFVMLYSCIVIITYTHAGGGLVLELKIHLEVFIVWRSAKLTA